MRKKLVAGNWKMHGSLLANQQLLDGVLTGCADLVAEVAVCVPYPYLAQVASRVAGSALRLGAQNVSQYAQGAYTGEVSVGMLRDFDCEYVILGHSERRALFGEVDAQVAAKCRAVLGGGLKPILCVGETLAEREAGATLAVVEHQLAAVLSAIGADGLDALVVAYEPVWAIGTGLTATPEQAQAVHAAIRRQLTDLDAVRAAAVRILYGGSVKPQNAVELFAQADIDGGLIGGAALVVEDFLAICRAVN